MTQALSLAAFAGDKWRIPPPFANRCRWFIVRLTVRQLVNCANISARLHDHPDSGLPRRPLESTSVLVSISRWSQPIPQFVVLTIGIWVDNCRLMSKSIRRSIWYHKAVFFGEMTFSKTGTYFIRSERSC